ncbi:MAG: hypothetical protein JSS36_08420 [Proteobacteria bacterium]|nr:hypothetical protein [Pseudomonadota bacterium]
MLRTVLAGTLPSLAIASSAVGAWLQDLPNPEAFARAEDRQRAMSIAKPCTEADLGRGCRREGELLVREIPCVQTVVELSITTLRQLPTDECYRMQPPRRYRGVWLDVFEGQAFVPSGSKAPRWPTNDPRSPHWRERLERARAASIWLDVSRVGLKHDFRDGGRKVLIEFIGRQTEYPGHYGHMGMAGHEIIVDKVISLKTLE